MTAHPPPPNTLGADIRALRKARGVTLQQLADRMGRSVGWISQVERDLSDPTLEDLRSFAAEFDVPVSMLLRPSAAVPQEAGRVVRANARRPIGHSIDGLSETLLSPDLTDSFEMVHSTFEPNSAITVPVTRPTQEVGFLLSGQLEITIAGEVYQIQPGDSFRIRGESFLWANPHDTPAVAVWVISPPVY
ncbi:MAG: XRE family transcriptional regulator [Pelagimonas sp.]|jgi:transcriptional regulator with XRE-family HTH domain|nr:XRE family transcriptional regulator [Pelagimonas sp.]